MAIVSKNDIEIVVKPQEKKFKTKRQADIYVFYKNVLDL